MVSKKRIKGEIKQEWIAEKKLYKKNGTLLVHEPQKEVARQIISGFSSNDLVTLCAPPTMGENGGISICFLHDGEKRRYKPTQCILYYCNV